MKYPFILVEYQEHIYYKFMDSHEGDLAKARVLAASEAVTFANILYKLDLYN